MEGVREPPPPPGCVASGGCGAGATVVVAGDCFCDGEEAPLMGRKTVPTTSEAVDAPFLPADVGNQGGWGEGAGAWVGGLLQAYLSYRRDCAPTKSKTATEGLTIN